MPEDGCLSPAAHSVSGWVPVPSGFYHNVATVFAEFAKGADHASGECQAKTRVPQAGGGQADGGYGTGGQTSLARPLAVGLSPWPGEQDKHVAPPAT